VTRSQRGPAVTCVAVGVLLIALAACGSGTDPDSDVSSGGGSDPVWVGQVLEGEPGPDQPTPIAVNGDQVVVAIVSEDGVITGFATDERGQFSAGAPAMTGHQYLSLGGIARLGDGWVAVGSSGLRDGEELLFDLRAFRSDDGRTWSQVDATGLDGPADATGLITVDDGVIALGTLRTANDPAQGGFRPVAWHSADGQRWTAVALPTGEGTEGSVHAAVVTGDEVLAVGRVDDTGAMWSSTDKGASWTLVERDGIEATLSLSHIAAQGEVLVASGMTPPHGDGDGEGSHLLVFSTDGGRSWHEAAEPPPSNRRVAFASPVFAGGGHFFTLGHSFIDARSDPELCYADIELCRRDSVAALYVSDDGDRWSRVDTSRIGDADAGDVDAITATDDGRIIAFRRVDAGLGAWTWPAATPLLTEDEPVDPTTDVVILPEGEMPEPGRRYGVPLYIHCGMDWLYVDGEAWQRSDGGPDTETGAGDEIPDDWPVAQQTIFGFATLVSDDLIEYSLGDGEVIATYAPSAQSPPGCE
jgi:hypothetical protein